MENKPKKTKKLCYLCGRPGADTREHIPPRGIFPKKPSGKLIKVPAHYECNHKFHNDDELFRNLIIMSSWRTLEGQKAWKGQVVPSWQKNPGAKRELQKRFTAAWIKDNTSQALVRAPAVKMEIPLVERQIERWTKGLFYHKFGEPMPPDLPVKVDRLNPPEESLIPFLNYLREEGLRPIWVHVEPNIFSYTYITSEEDKHIGFAIFVFFNTEVYLGATGI